MEGVFANAGAQAQRADSTQQAGICTGPDLCQSKTSELQNFFGSNSHMLDRLCG